MNPPHWMLVAAISFMATGVSFRVCAEGPASGLLPQATLSGDDKIQKLAQDLSSSSLKPRLTVLNAVVSIDGIQRSDLGISFSDTVSAKLMESGEFEILDSASIQAAPSAAAPASGSLLNDQGIVIPASPTESVKTSGADFVIAPTLVGNAGEYRLTARKLRMSDGKIEKVIQETFRGDQKAFFAMAGKLANQFLPEKALPPPPKAEPAYTYVKAWMAPPPPYDPVARQIADAPKALRAIKSLESHVSRSPSKIGSVIKVEPSWSFCELNCAPGTAKIGEEIFVWSGLAQDSLVALKVSRIDGERMIAEFDSLQPLTKSLRPGNSIYTWKSLAK